MIGEAKVQVAYRDQAEELCEFSFAVTLSFFRSAVLSSEFFYLRSETTYLVIMAEEQYLGRLKIPKEFSKQCSKQDYI